MTHIGQNQAFFTQAKEINDLMVALLGDVSGATVLEPCVGNGALLFPIQSSAAHVDAIDVDPSFVSTLAHRVNEHVHLQVGNFLEHFVIGAISSGIKLRPTYDALICNPPYGLKLTKDFRALTKRRFPKLYARESYGLFMQFGVTCLREGGRFVFIVPDTFLSSHNHKSLRDSLLRNATITDVIVFNSKRFEAVNFGYGSMCIIAGNARRDGQYGDLRWVDARESSVPLATAMSSLGVSRGASELTETVESGWYSKPPSQTYAPMLGDFCELKTGIYTGDNEKYCSYSVQNPPSRLNGHPIDWCEVRTASLGSEEMLYGISEGPTYVPFVRGGHRLPFASVNSAIQWSVEAIKEYKSNKKARFQNSSFYFRRGLAVPMVTSGKLTASFMENAVFDQGVVGVFPRRNEHLDYFLVFLNSAQATEQKLRINPSANNSANYLKKIRVVPPVEQKVAEAAEIVARWRSNSQLSFDQVRLDATEFVNSLTT